MPDRAQKAPHAPALSVAIVVGAQRARAQELLGCLARQTVSERIEVVLVDTRPALTPLSAPPGLAVRALSGADSGYGAARAEATLAARAPYVAFLEDHCFPSPGWAACLLAACRDPVDAVGYSFANHRPSTRASRVVHLATYGEWEHPRAGAVTSLPGGNVAYRRELLWELRERLACLLEADYNLHTLMLARGCTMIAAPGARVAHQSESRLRQALQSGFVYSRTLAAARVQLEGWSVGTRAAVAGKDLVGAPLARLRRLVVASSPARRRRPGFVLCLPAVVLLYLASATGEAAGYLAGPPRGPRDLRYWEVDAPRT